MKKVEAEFKFEVFELVEPVGAGSGPIEMRRPWLSPPERAVYQVLTQWVQICSAQCVQIHYTCRPSLSNGRVDGVTILFMEGELQKLREVVVVDEEKAAKPKMA